MITHESVLHAIMDGNVNEISKALDKDKGLLRSTDKMGRTLLMEAAIFKRHDICKLLVSRGADVNAREKGRGWTALHFAAQECAPDITKLLLGGRAEVDVQDTHGNTPLCEAVFNSRGRGEVIRLLIEHGADRNLKNNSGVSPSDLARMITNYNVKQFIE